MPGLDYKNGVPLSVGAFGPGPKRYYDGTPGRKLVTCPDCGHPADKQLGGDHSGTCLDVTVAATPNTALGLIRRHALANGRFSANDLRAAFKAAGVPGTKRGPAFAAAEKRRWIENDGYIRSTDGPTKGHPVATYRSLIFEPRKAAS